MKRIVRSSRIVCLIASVVPLVSIASYAHAEFYVIPIPTDNCSCECPPTDCGGTSGGSKAFVLDTPESWAEIGTVYSTTEGRLVKITGASTSMTPGVYYQEGESFLVAPSTLPDPFSGVKAPYYYFNNGQIIFAKYL